MTATKVRFRFACPETGLPVDGTFAEPTGRLNLWPDAPPDSTLRQRQDCIMWCIRSESSAFLSWGDARWRLAGRGVAHVTIYGD